jgi:hypothetical protein
MKNQDMSKYNKFNRAHEGTKPVKKAKIQLDEGQLDRFVILLMMNVLKRC